MKYFCEYVYFDCVYSKRNSVIKTLSAKAYWAACLDVKNNVHNTGICASVLLTRSMNL